MIGENPNLKKCSKQKRVIFTGLGYKPILFNESINE